MDALISVIIPTMNRPDSLKRTLEHFAVGKVKPQQIIVVDQSQDEVTRKRNSDILHGLSESFKDLRYVYQELPSLTKARNTGLSYTENEIIVFADDDIDVTVDTLANINGIMQDPTVAMIAGIDRLTRQSKSNLGYLLGTKSFRKRKIGHVTLSMLGRYPDNVDGRIETQWAQGFFFVVKKSLLEKWHCLWDENLTSYAYAEDLDFSFSYYKHAKAEGLKCVLDSNVIVDHLASLEYRIPGEKSIYMYLINRAYLSHKHNMGLKGSIASCWCNFWRFIEQVVGRKQARTFIKAWYCTIKYHKEIIKGNLDYDKFMK